MARRAHQYLPKSPRRREAVRWHVGECDKVTVHGVPCKRRLGDSGVIVRDAGVQAPIRRANRNACF